MLLAVGDFIFELKTLPFTNKKRSTTYRWAEQLPIASTSLYQFMGQGPDTLQLAGTLYPEVTGGVVDLSELRRLAASGEAQALTGGDGYLHGLWFIESIADTQTHFLSDGIAAKIEFTIALRYQKDAHNSYGGLDFDAGNLDGGYYA